MTVDTPQSTNKPPINQRYKMDSRSSIHFLAGGVGGLVGAVCTSPLDVVKTRLQKQGAYWSESSKSKVFGGISKDWGPIWSVLFQQGILSLESESTADLTLASFWLYTELNHGKETPVVHLVSAATAGLVTSTVTNPIWVIKTRLQLQGNTRLYKNSLDCVMHIIREEGVRGLYKGMSASYLGVAEGTIQWVTYEHLKRKWAAPKNLTANTIGGKSAKEWMGNLGAAAVSKFVAACISYPHEVVRTRLRQPAENGVIKYTGLWQCFKLVWKEEGMVALYGGMSAHLMRVVPNAAIMFFCYEAILHNFTTTT
ncbi:hypothetical protein [Absidia glauca]|uniref:Mitochondrial carrier n=1 Tax=Absidia glauca TaxID=4829 RepID=A0A168PP84_ABSGL|nr:hypothetical protein [Absidia glauca]